MNINVFTQFKKDWALVTAGNKDNYNTMLIGWGGLGTLWGKDVCTIYIRPSRYTYQYLEENDYFTVSFYDEAYKKDLSIMGAYSGRDTDKVGMSQLTPIEVPDSITFKEATTTLLCKKIYIQDLDPTQIPEDVMVKDYPSGDIHRMYIGEVIQIL